MRTVAQLPMRSSMASTSSFTGCHSGTCSSRSWNAHHPRVRAAPKRGYSMQPAATEPSVKQMVAMLPLTKGAATTQRSSAVAGSSMRTRPHVGRGTRKGRCRCGCLCRSRMNAMNSSSSARQYTTLSISTICMNSKEIMMRTPREESSSPRVGVPWRERRDRIFGSMPRSDMPSSWYESLDISAWYCPSWLTAAAMTMSTTSHLPATWSATLAK
mmetsp:Transcript_22680/g.58053  ORF Transcript_22680/g.58053 Transcript_22680/m.58053 type:complete len:214 (-) Transcript_22680:1063-1704(-)